MFGDVPSVATKLSQYGYSCLSPAFVSRKDVNLTMSFSNNTSISSSYMFTYMKPIKGLSSKPNTFIVNSESPSYLIANITAYNLNITYLNCYLSYINYDSKIPCKIISGNSTDLSLSFPKQYLIRNGLSSIFLAYNQDEAYNISNVNIAISSSLHSIQCKQVNQYISISISDAVPAYSFKLINTVAVYGTSKLYNPATPILLPSGLSYLFYPFPSLSLPVNTTIYIGDQYQSSCIVGPYAAIQVTSVSYESCSPYFSCNITAYGSGLLYATPVQAQIDSLTFLPYVILNDYTITITSPSLSTGTHALRIIINGTVSTFNLSVVDNYVFKNAILRNNRIEIVGINMTDDMFCLLDQCHTTPHFINSTLLYCYYKMCYSSLPTTATVSVLRSKYNGTSNRFMLQNNSFPNRIQVVPELLLEGTTTFMLVAASAFFIENTYSLSMWCPYDLSTTTCTTLQENVTQCSLDQPLFKRSSIQQCSLSIENVNITNTLTLMQNFLITSITPSAIYALQEAKIEAMLSFINTACSYICFIGDMSVNALLSEDKVKCNQCRIPSQSLVVIGCAYQGAIYFSKNSVIINAVNPPVLLYTSPSIYIGFPNQITLVGTGIDPSNKIGYGLSQYTPIFIINSTAATATIQYNIDKPYIYISLEDSQINSLYRSNRLMLQLNSIPDILELIGVDAPYSATSRVIYIRGSGLSPLQGIGIIVNNQDYECSFISTQVFMCTISSIAVGRYQISIKSNYLIKSTALYLNIYTQPTTTLSQSTVLREALTNITLTFSSTPPANSYCILSYNSNYAMLPIYQNMIQIPKLRSEGSYTLQLAKTNYVLDASYTLQVINQIEVFYVLPMYAPMDQPLLITITGRTFFSDNYTCNFEGTRTNATIVSLYQLSCFTPTFASEGLKLLTIIWSANYETLDRAPIYFYQRLQPISYFPKILPISTTANATVQIAQYPYNRVYLQCKLNNEITTAILVNNSLVLCPSISVAIAGNYTLYVSRSNYTWETVGVIIFYALPAIQKLSPFSTTELSQELVFIEGKSFLTYNSAICRFTISDSLQIIDVIADSTVYNLIQCKMPLVEAGHSLSVSLSYDGLFFYATNASIAITSIPIMFSVTPSFGYSSTSMAASVINQNYFTDTIKFYIGNVQTSLSTVNAITTSTIPTLVCSSITISEIVFNSSQNQYYDTMFHYQYCPLYTVTSFTPQYGNQIGGTIVNITGSNFKNSPYLAARFGTLASNCTYMNDHLIRCISPGVAALPASVALSITLNGADYISVSSPLFSYYNDITITGLIPSFAFKNTENFTVYVIATNIQSMSNLYCKVHDLVIKGEYYLINQTTPSVKCIISSYKQINMTKLSDIINDEVKISLSNNGIEFSSSTMIFSFISNSDNFVSVFPLVGPSAGNTVITLIVKQYLEDPYGQNKALCM